MRYDVVDVYNETVIEVDELNDEVTERTIAEAGVNSRFTEWNAQDIETHGREFTKTHRKVLLKINGEIIKNAKYIMKEDELYEITKMVDLYRWTLAYIKRYRV